MSNTPKSSVPGDPFLLPLGNSRDDALPPPETEEEDRLLRLLADWEREDPEGAERIWPLLQEALGNGPAADSESR